MKRTLTLGAATLMMGSLAIVASPAKADFPPPMVDPAAAAQTCGPCAVPTVAYDVVVGVGGAVLSLITFGAVPPPGAASTR